MILLAYAIDIIDIDSIDTSIDTMSCIECILTTSSKGQCDPSSEAELPRAPKTTPGPSVSHQSGLFV